jgi:hypothetical protein
MEITQPKTSFLTRIKVSEPALIVFIGILIILVMGLHLAYLTNYPTIHGDEAWSSSASWNWLTTGNNFDFIHSGPLDQFGYEWTRRMFIGQFPWVVSFMTLGLGLFQARLVSWFFGLLLLALTIVVGNKLYGRLAGFLAALFLSLSQPFLLTSHSARQDMMLAVFIMLAYLLAIYAFEQERWWLHFLAGLVVGLGFDVHLNASQFVLPLAALYLVHYRTKLFTTRGTWLVAAGGIIGIGYFALLHLLPGNGAFFTLEGFNFADKATHSFIQTLDFGALASTIVDEIGIYHFFDQSLGFGLVGAGTIMLLFRGNEADRRLLAFTAAAMVSFFLLRARTADVYAILLYPFFMLVVAGAFIALLSPLAQMKGDVPNVSESTAGPGGTFAPGSWGVLSESPAVLKSQQAFISALLVLFVVSSFRQVIRPFREHADYDYYALTNQIAEVTPAAATVMGLPTWWLGLSQYDYRSSLNLLYYDFFNDYTLDQGMQAMQPDVVIVDEIFRTSLEGDQFRPVPYWEMPGDDFEAFIKRQGTLVLEINDPHHGDIEVYSIDWSGSQSDN